ncbi:hypothetical protein DRH14_03180, partial [Candidatus Shapirobacteria bacterium]
MERMNELSRRTGVEISFPVYCHPIKDTTGSNQKNSLELLLPTSLAIVVTVCGCGKTQTPTQTPSKESSVPTQETFNLVLEDFSETLEVITRAREKTSLTQVEQSNNINLPDVNERLPELPGPPLPGEECPQRTFKITLVNNPSQITVGKQVINPVLSGGGQEQFAVLPDSRLACAIIGTPGNSQEALVINEGWSDGTAEFVFPPNAYYFGETPTNSSLPLETQAEIMARLSIHWERFLVLDERLKSGDTDVDLQIAALHDYVSLLNLLQILAKNNPSMANEIYDYIGSVLLFRQETYVNINNNCSEESRVKPEYLQRPIDVVLHRDQEIVNSPPLIASLALEQAQIRQEVSDFTGRVDLVKSVLYIYYFQDIKESYQETNFSILSWLLPGEDFERYQREDALFSDWMEEKKEEWVSNHGGTLEQAYQQYLQNYGVSSEKVPFVVFNVNILNRLMLDDLIQERGLRQNELEKIIKDVLITAFNNYGQARQIFLGQMAGQLADPGFREEVRWTLEEMRENGTNFPDGMTVDNLMAQLDQTDFSIFDEEIQSATEKLAKEIRESLQYLGKIQEIQLRIPTGILDLGKEEVIIQEADGLAFYRFYDEDGKEVTISGKIVDDNGRAINLTQPYGFHSVNWQFISDDNTKVVNSDQIKIGQLSLWSTVPRENILDRTNDLIGNKPFVDLENVQETHINLNGKRFVRLAFFPDKNGNTTIGAIVKTKDNSGEETEEFCWFIDLINQGSEKVEKYEQRYGSEIRLLPGFYGKNGESLNEILEVIFGGSAIRTSEGFQNLDPNILLRQALAEALIQTPQPTNVFGVMIPKKPISNLEGETSSPQTGVPVYVAINHNQSATDWLRLSTSWQKEDETQMFLTGATLVQLEPYKVNPQIVKIDGQNFYILARVNRPEGKITDNLVGWQLFRSLLEKNLSREDEATMALLVPVDKIKIINNESWINRLWEAGGLKDILSLMAYFSSLAVLGELNLAAPEGLLVINQIVAEMAMRTGTPRIIAYLLLLESEKIKVVTE